MKRKINSLIASGLLLGQLAASAQDNQAVSADTTTNTQPAAEATAAVAATQPQATAEPVAETAASAEAAAATSDLDSSNAVTVPLIVMDEVPLTDAIKNLARQANINYMLDPKINFGQPGPDGRPIPQPNVSIRWENISAGQALNALLNNYSLQLVEDTKTKIARISTKDPAAPEPLITKIIQLKYASPSNMLASVQTALVDKRSKIMPDVRTSQLVVLATEGELETLDRLIEQLDTPTKQVLIEARLLETRINPTSIKGIDWTGTLAAQHATFGNNALPGTPSTTTPVLDPGGSGTVIGSTTTPGTIGGILGGVGSGSGLLGSLSKGSFFQPATAFMNADGVSLILSFLNNNAETKILSSPRTVTLDNETAHIEVGQQYPIINVTAGTANTTGGSSISYSNLTVALDVTPRISANDFINLKVSPHAMRLQQVQKFTAGGQTFDVPIFDTRMIETSVMIPSGHTLVMGGLMEDDVAMQNTKVPILGDIPGLGYLFRKDSKSRTKQNLIIFITPTIVEASDFQTTKTEFLKTPVPKSDSLEKDWSAWDSGKPRDWSKPAKFQDLPTQ